MNCALETYLQLIEDTLLQNLSVIPYIAYKFTEISFCHHGYNTHYYNQEYHNSSFSCMIDIPNISFLPTDDYAEDGGPEEV